MSITTCRGRAPRRHARALASTSPSRASFNKPEWQRTVKSRAEALAWLAAASSGGDHLRAEAARGPLFEALAEQWLDGVEQGRIERRRGRGQPDSETANAPMRRSTEYHLVPAVGPKPGAQST